MKSIIFVGLGGMGGSILRYLISSGMDKYQLGNFPLGTFTVNILGCLLIGVLYGFSIKYNWFDQQMNLLLITGLCGGFTTFSTFSMEQHTLWAQSQMLPLLLYTGLSLFLGVIFVWLGLTLSR